VTGLVLLTGLLGLGLGYVVLNGDPDAAVRIPLPPGRWSVLVDADVARPDRPLGTVGADIIVPPTSGVVLRAEATR
jgi:hypothetical protein